MKSLYILGIVVIVLLAFWLVRSGAWPKTVYRKATISVREHGFVVDVADTPIKQAKGLSGRKSLEPNEGMLFVFDSASMRTFWMKDTLIPIDIIWIREKKIVGINSRVGPQPGTSLYKLERYRSPERVDFVLEIAAGRAEELGIQVGDSVDIGLAR